MPDAERLPPAGGAAIAIRDEHARVEVAPVGHHAVEDDVGEILIAESPRLLRRVRDRLERAIRGRGPVAIRARRASLDLGDARCVGRRIEAAIEGKAAVGEVAVEVEAAVREVAIEARVTAIGDVRHQRRAVVVAGLADRPVGLGVLRDGEHRGPARPAALGRDDRDLACVVAAARHRDEDARHQVRTVLERLKLKVRLRGIRETPRRRIAVRGYSGNGEWVRRTPGNERRVHGGEDDGDRWIGAGARLSAHGSRSGIGVAARRAAPAARAAADVLRRIAARAAPAGGNGACAPRDERHHCECHHGSVRESTHRGDALLEQTIGDRSPAVRASARRRRVPYKPD